MTNNDRYTPNLDLFDALKSKDSGNMTIGDLKESPSGLISSAVKVAARDPEIDVATYGKYSKYGVRFDWDKYISGELDYALWKNQSAWNQFTNALGQTFVSEIGLGTVKAFSDLSDVIIGEAFKGDNDYSNPLSVKLEEWQEAYKNRHPIYTDPTRPIGHGAMGDWGWWMTNFPSIASSLTLLVPGLGAAKVASFATKLAGKGLRNAVSFTRKASNGLNRARQTENLAKVGRFENFINRPNVRTISNYLVETGANALTMRHLENYQEARQVYNDMMSQIKDSWNTMTDEEKQDFIDRNNEVFKKHNADINNIDSIARAIAKESADKTYQIDMANLVFDVLQVATLHNPLKVPKNFRTTYKINKAQRESKLIAQLGTQKATKKLAERSFGRKVLDFSSDLGKAKWLVTGQLTEGVEEAVNYIAQQEGMHYGNLMLNPKEAMLEDSDRLNSYLRSPELYEAAFWGFLGGVVFEGGGSQIKRLSNAAINTIKTNKNYNDKTKEGKKTTFAEQYQTSENKRRVAEIESRYENLEKLKKRRKEIFEQGISPFSDDVDENGKRLELKTDIEKEAAWSRAVDDFIIKQSYLAIEAGNFDLFKDYLRSDGVKQLFKDMDSSTDVEKLISRMDEIDKIYTDELIKVDSLLGNEKDIPLEYVSVIARDNADARFKIQHINEKIRAYETKADADKIRFNIGVNEELDYKNAVELIVAIENLKALRQRKQEIEKDATTKGSLRGQAALRLIDSRIKSVNAYVASLQNTENTNKLTSFVNSLFTTFNSIDTESDDYVNLMMHIANRNIAEINKITGQNFELNDDEIVKVFGEAGTSTGSYYTFSEQMREHFGAEFDEQGNLKRVSKFEEKAPLLVEDYMNLASLNLAKYLEEGNISNNKESISNKVNQLHNFMNEARHKAISDARDGIIRLAEIYGKDVMLLKVMQNIDIPNITEEDNTKLNSYLAVLNLTNPNNEVLIDMIQANIMLGDYKKNTEDTTEDTEDTDEKPEPDEKKQIQITPDTDKGVNVSFVPKDNSNNKETTFDYVETENGYELQLNPNLTKEQQYKIFSNKALFDGYDENNSNPIDKVTMPIIQLDDNGNVIKITKGVVTYKRPTPAPKPTVTNTSTPEPKAEQPEPQPISPTGGEEQAPIPPVSDDDNADNPDINPEEEAKRLEEINKIISAKKAILPLLVSFKAGKITEDELRNKIQEIKDSVKDIENANADIEQTVTFLTNKFNLINIFESSIKCSTVVEKESLSGDEDISKLSEDVIQSVEDVIKKYVEAGKLAKTNGKYYINFEDFIANLNHLGLGEFGTDTYKYFRAFFKSDYNQEYILTDNPNDPNLEENIAKTREERIKERIGELSKYRVQINHLFEQPTKAFLKEFYNLQQGDVLNVEKNEDGSLILKHNNIVVGRLGIPSRTENNDGYQIINKGWLFTIYDDKNRKSRIQTYFEALAADEEANGLINDILYNDSQESVDKLYELFQNKELDGQKGSGFINPDEAVDSVVEFVCNLWRYKMGAIDFTQDAENVTAKITFFLRPFFYKLRSTYDALDQLSRAVSTKNNNIQVEVANINDGELNRVVEDAPATPNQPRDNYAKFTQSHIAFEKRLDIRIGAVKEEGKLDLGTNETIHHKALGSKGTIHVLIPNRNGKPNFCVATSCLVSDRNLDKNSDAYKIVEAAKTWIDRLVDNQDGGLEQTLARLSDGVCKLMYKHKNYAHIPIFYGPINAGLYNPNRKSGRKHDFTIGTQNNSLVLELDRTGEFKVRVVSHSTNSETGEVIDNSFEKEYRFDIEEGKKALKGYLHSLLNYCSFNLDFRLLESIQPTDSDDCIRYDRNGKIVVSVGEFTKTYSDLTDAFVNGGFVRVNTEQREVGNGFMSNYSREGKTQGANQIFEVEFNKVTPPVEEKNESKPQQQASSTVTEETGENIINNSDANTAVDKLVHLALPNLSKTHEKALKTDGFLPKEIGYEETLEDNDGNEAFAQSDIITGRVTVTRLWLDMYDGNGTYVKDKDFYRKQAIRKLIHEQVHLKIGQYGREDALSRIKVIYDEFKQYLDKNEEDKKVFGKYLFEGKKNIDEALEEFLVESFTSKELTEKLNTIEASYEGVHIKGQNEDKETLFDKLLKLIAKIFGYDFVGKNNRVNVNKKSLLQKELYALRDALIIDKKEEEKPAQTKKPLPKFGQFKKDGNSFNSTVNEVVDKELVEQIKAIDNEMQQIKAQAIADGTFMKAPNGNPSNLNERQWLQVRTKNFKNWFGDWTKITFDKDGKVLNTPDDVSKVVDENGEPLVVYHGSDDVFTIFDIDKFGKTDQGDLGRGFYFGYRKDTAKQYGNNILEVFLNIRNPFIHKGESTQNIVKGFNREYNPTIKEKLNKTITTLEHKIEAYKKQLLDNNSVERVSLLNKNINYYSTLVNNYKEELRTRKDLDEKSFDTLKDYDGVIEETKSYQLVAKNPNQIKSATDNIGTFSRDNNDIRYSTISETPNSTKSFLSVQSFISSISPSNQPALARLLACGEISTQCR